MILKNEAILLVAATTLVVSSGCGTGSGAAAGKPPVDAGCDPALARFFTPERPVLGRYEACVDPRAIAELAPAGWSLESVEPGDAFDGTGSYDRASLLRLYGGRRAQVARGWTESADRFAMTTLVSPYPTSTMTVLEPGTLIIRWICDRENADCQISEAGR
jgi:hypothetical protein